DIEPLFGDIDADGGIDRLVTRVSHENLSSLDHRPGSIPGCICYTTEGESSTPGRRGSSLYASSARHERHERLQIPFGLGSAGNRHGTHLRNELTAQG